MWIVRLALRRTYSFVVTALLIAVLGAVSIYRMSTDIFPNIDIPVVSLVWQFAGTPAAEIKSRLILVNERVLTASVNDIEHIESQSLDGVGEAIEVLTGLNAGNTVVIHPGDDIPEGTVVEPVPLSG
jgi:multidrug efflux pump subunit AcrB